MGLFDRGSGSGVPWQVDAITLEYVLSGRIEGDALKWGWAYFEFPPADDAAIAIWDQWNTFPTVGVDVLIGPYALSGSVLSIDGSATSPMLGACFAMRDATLTRIDGAGDATPLALPRLTVESRFVHALSAR